MMSLPRLFQGFRRGAGLGPACLLSVAFVGVLLGHVAPARANLTIIPTFDSTITSDPNALAIENVINNAILIYQSTFTDPITVNITFAEISTGLGQSNFFYYAIPYSTVRAALIADAKTANDASAIQYIGPNVTTNPVTGTTGVNIKAPNARALGINLGNTGSDGTISLNTHITDVGSPGTTGQYSLRAVAQHEIDEILGLGSSLPSPFQNNPAPEDLFRYSAAGVRSFTTTLPQAQPYLSIDGGTTSLVQYNTNAGGDYGDYNGVGGPHVQDAFATPGASPVLSNIELTALDVIGYDRTTTQATPEPDALTMLGLIAGGVSAYGLWRRRRAGSGQAAGPVPAPVV